MSKGDRSAKDKAMASRMKEEGIIRTDCRCPICNNLVRLDSLPLHILNHQGQG